MTDRRSLRTTVLLLGLGASVFPDSSAIADGEVVESAAPVGVVGNGIHSHSRVRDKSQCASCVRRDFYGFGLKYHSDYGYGGRGLGVGPFGGYPSYGGPGYPHEPPPLQRLGRIAPTLYFGGLGSSLSGHANFYEGVGPLVIRRPLIDVGDRGELGGAGGFGPFTGSHPYPDTLFAPFSTPTTAPSRDGSTSTPVTSATPGAGTGDPTVSRTPPPNQGPPAPRGIRPETLTR